MRKTRSRFFCALFSLVFIYGLPSSAQVVTAALRSLPVSAADQMSLISRISTLISSFQFLAKPGVAVRLFTI